MLEANRLLEDVLFDPLKEYNPVSTDVCNGQYWVLTIIEHLIERCTQVVNASQVPALLESCGQGIAVTLVPRGWQAWNVLSILYTGEDSISEVCLKIV